MQQWEYDQLIVGHADQLQRHLTEAGKQGWECYHVAETRTNTIPPSTQIVALLKRPVDDTLRKSR